MRRALLLALLATSPAVAQTTCPFAGQTPQLLVQLFFGQGIRRDTGPDTLISRAAWRRFVADTLTPALAQGFTVLDTTGQYGDQQTGAVIHEPTELVLVAAPDTDAFRARITAIVNSYRRRFMQRSVGVVTQSACAAF